MNHATQFLTREWEQFKDKVFAEIEKVELGAKKEQGGQP